MNNKHFIQHCATLVLQANQQKLSSFTVKDLFVWDNMSSEHASYQVMKKMCDYNVLVKINKRTYALSDSILKHTSSLFGGSVLPEENVLAQTIAKFLDIKQERARIETEPPVVHRAEDELDKIVKAVGFCHTHLRDMINELKAAHQEQIANLCAELERVRAVNRELERENKKLKTTREIVKQSLIDQINSL